MSNTKTAKLIEVIQLAGENGVRVRVEDFGASGDAVIIIDRAGDGADDDPFVMIGADENGKFIIEGVYEGSVMLDESEYHAEHIPAMLAIAELLV